MFILFGFFIGALIILLVEDEKDIPEWWGPMTVSLFIINIWAAIYIIWG